MENYIKLIRPKHWLKNILIFLPSTLALEFDKLLTTNSIYAFIAMSLIASGGYILNDIKDVQKDRIHPKKKFRPIADGTVPVKKAFILAILLIITSLFLISLINKESFFILVLYFTLNTAYSNYFKRIKYLDIAVLSSFYLLRLELGSCANHTELTGWFISTMTMAFVTLSLNKRYSELMMSKNASHNGRGYETNDISLLKILMINTSLTTLVFLNIHAFFILKIQTPQFFGILNLLTLLIVLNYFDEKKNNSDDPVERIISNPALILYSFILIAIYVFKLIYN
jgi:decaprenyl-phosphate phosphoribosyltransferase